MFSAAQISFPVIFFFNPNPAPRRIRKQLPDFRLLVSSKKWNFQDFQGYAKPTRLFPSSDVQVCSAPSMEQTIGSSSTHGFEALYRIKLHTSVMYGSGLTDLNSGVLVCVIDENSNSILVRLPACTTSTDAISMPSEGNVMSEDVLHFQRGSADEFVFKGPALGSIAATWISVESGQWRLGSMNLTVVSQQRPPLQYKFDIDNALLGEGTDFPMIECRPCSVAEFSEKDLDLSSDIEISKSSSSKEAMKEYADLKFSLLFYDTILVLAGTLFASISTGDHDPAIAFLTGGAGGFLYLLLLQRSVDTLPAKDLFTGETDQGVLGNIKGSVTALVLAFAFAIVVAKCIAGDGDRMLAPEEVIFGMVGFLMCKISVVLAAFKPLPIGLKEIEK